MLSMFSAIRPGYLVVGVAVAAGLYAVRGAERTHAPAPAAKQVAIAPQLPVVAPPVLDDDNGDSDDTDEAIDEATDEDVAEEEMRGLDAIEDPAEFAMVFSVDGTTYLRLSDEKRATSHGRLSMVTDASGGVYAAIANVATGAMPADLRSWAGRTVLVDGTCTAHVTGFAEVSRVSGDPPGTEDYYYASMEDGGERERAEAPPVWDAEAIREQNITLAAKLDGCEGTWARATEYPAAAIAEWTSEPELEQEAMKQVLALADSDDLEQWWKDTGNEGTWQDSVKPSAQTYIHPLTGEKWIVARVYQEGGCGDFGVSQMSAFHVSAGGKLHKVADLGHAGESLQDVVDLDGDGQPELVFGSGDEATLVDLTDSAADSISVPSFTWGCGC